MKLKVYLNIILIGMFTIVLSCKGSSYTSKQIRKAERKIEAHTKESEKLYLEAVKSHKGKQSDKTLKQMKKSKRKSRKLNRKKREPFFKRLFGL